MLKVQIKNLNKVYEQKKNMLSKKAYQVHALKELDLEFESGKITAIVGESGSGKSTLARLITQLEASTSGGIVYEGAGFDTKQAFQMVFQNPFSSLNPKWRVGKILAEGLHYLGLDSHEINRQIENILDEVQLSSDYKRKFPHQLSGGECQRVALARALLMQPNLLVLDEVTSSLDLPTQTQILRLISTLVKNRDMITIFISHDLSVVKKMADHVYVLEEGELVEEGEVSQIMNNPKHEYTKSLLQAARVCGVNV